MNEKKYGLLGKSLKHSFSPKLHQEIFKQMGISADYKLIEKEYDQLELFFEKGIYQYKGINVTIPYKQAVMPYLNRIDPFAELIGAVNTIHVKDSQLVGYNTDYEGFSFLLEAFLSHFSQKNMHNYIPVILGTGGASKSVIASVINHNFTSLVWVTRDKKLWQTDEVFDKWKDYCIKKNIEINVIDYHELEKWAIENKKTFFLINTTPVGMYPHVDDLITSDRCIEHSIGVIDLIYNPKETVFMKCSLNAKLPTIGGLGMLIEQGIKAEEIWQERVLDGIQRKVMDVINQK